MNQQQPSNNFQRSYSLMTAEVYDAIYAGRDYQRETEQIRAIIDDRLRTDGNRLLDVACGTGNHIPFLSDKFDITGLDLSTEQLTWAQQKFPGLEFKQGNMIDFQLDDRYDVVTCLFSSIAYADQVKDFRRAIANMANHLKPGGVLVIGSFFSPESYRPGTISASFVDQDELKISRMTIANREGERAIWDMHHLIARPTGISHFVEQHRLGLYSSDQYQKAVRDAGLDPRCDDSSFSDRPLISGLKSIQK